MWDEPNEKLKCQKRILKRDQKKHRFILTAGRWPRKLESAKKCVTTYLPNESVFKINDSKMIDLYFSIISKRV